MKYLISIFLLASTPFLLAMSAQQLDEIERLEQKSYEEWHQCFSECLEGVDLNIMGVEEARNHCTKDACKAQREAFQKALRSRRKLEMEIEEGN